MIGANVNKTQRISVVLKVIVKFGSLRSHGIFKIHKRKAAHANGKLIHKAAGLAKILIFRELAGKSQINGGEFGALPKRFHGASQSRFNGRRRRESAASGNGAGKCNIKSPWGKAPVDQCYKHPAGNADG